MVVFRDGYKLSSKLVHVGKLVYRDSGLANMKGALVSQAPSCVNRCGGEPSLKCSLWPQVLAALGKRMEGNQKQPKPSLERPYTYLETAQQKPGSRRDA